MLDINRFGALAATRYNTLKVADRGGDHGAA